MVIVKRSEARVDTVYENKGDALKEIAARSLRCARCGAPLDPSAEGPMVACAACGHRTPRMVAVLEETKA